MTQQILFLGLPCAHSVSLSCFSLFISHFSPALSPLVPMSGNVCPEPCCALHPNHSVSSAALEQRSCFSYEYLWFCLSLALNSFFPGQVSQCPRSQLVSWQAWSMWECNNIKGILLMDCRKKTVTLKSKNGKEKNKSVFLICSEWAH